jgi:Flp pilus assembly protein TadD
VRGQANWQTAIRELTKAIQLNAHDPETHYDLGKTELESGNIAEAILELETAVRLMPDDASYHQELGIAYERAFRMADAEKERRIVEQFKASQAPAANAGASTGKSGPGR